MYDSLYDTLAICTQKAVHEVSFDANASELTSYVAKYKLGISRGGREETKAQTRKDIPS